MTTPQSIASNIRWSRETDRTAATAAARRAGPSSIEWHERKVDPDGVMDAETRRKAAENHRRAYYARLTRAGVKARQAKKAARAAARAAARESVRQAAELLGPEQVVEIAQGGEAPR